MGSIRYCSTTPKFEERIAFWEQQRFGWKDLSSMDHLSLPTVVSINIAIRAFSCEGDRIIIQTPVYDPAHGDHSKKKDREVSCLQQAEKP